MLFTKFTLMAVAASGVFAQPPATTAVALEKREVGEACSSAIVKNSAALTDIPSPNSAVVKVASSATITSDCQIPAVTGDGASDYSSYFSQYSSWQGKYKSQLNDIVSVCSKDLDQVFKTSANPFAGVSACTTLSWAPAQTGDKKGAATRQTGATVAVIALAGLAAAAIF